MIPIMVGHFDCKQICHIEKNVSIAFILPSRWQDGAESLDMNNWVGPTVKQLWIFTMHVLYIFGGV